MIIAIPSRTRFNLGKSTLRWIPKEWLSRTYLFVPGDEYDKYRMSIFNYSYPEVQLIRCQYQTISQKRLIMAEYAQAQGEDKIIMVDDDLTQFATRIAPGKTALRKATPEDMVELFDTVEKYLDWYDHVGISPRFHNSAFVGDDPIVVENTRMMRFLAYKVDTLLDCKFDLPLCEDFYVTLQLLQRGYKDAVLYKWCQDQLATNTPGGCSHYRTQELHTETILKLHEMFPDITRVRQKENKGGGEFGTRIELTILWQKAYREKVDG